MLEEATLFQVCRHGSDGFEVPWSILPPHTLTGKSNGQLVSLFTRDLETARRHPVVGDRPLVLKGLRTWGDSRTEIVLGNESSEQLTGLVQKGFLNDAGVVIVL